MKPLITLKEELKNGIKNELYVLCGEENLIRKIYYSKIAELNGNIKFIESVQDLYKELEKKSLFQVNITYIVYNDLDYLKQKEKVYERLLKLSKNHCVVLVYDEIPEKGSFRKIFDEYITMFSYVTNDIAIKYVNKENHNIDINLAKRIAFDCYNSYNSIKEEMNKYNHYTKVNKDHTIDSLYYSLFIPRKEIPSPKEFANAFIKYNKDDISYYYNILKENECNILSYIPELYSTVNIFLYLKMYGKWDGGTKAYNAGEYWGRIKEIRDFNVIYNKNDLLDIRYMLNKLDKDVRSGKMPAKYSWEWLIGVIL